MPIQNAFLAYFLLRSQSWCYRHQIPDFIVGVVMNVLFTSGIRIEQHLGNGVISFGKEDIGLLRSDNSF